MQDAFQQAEEKFFKLRGKFAAGRISAEEFDAALQELVVQDDEGRVWMLGANTGRWYYTTSPQWVEAEPPSNTEEITNDATQDVVVSNDAHTSRENIAPLIEPRAGENERHSFEGKKSALAFLGIALALFVLAGIFFGVLNFDSPLFASADANPTPTRIVPRVAASNSIANSISPTPTRHIEPFVTPIPVSPTPALVIEPTTTEPALTVIPTITPNRNPGKAPESNSSLPPAVYITNIRVSPNPPPRQAQVTFTASFWNTNRESVGMYWRIILLDPNKARNKDYGESPFAGITVPPGRTEFSISYTPVNSGGPCVTLQALAARRRDDNSRVYLNATNGSAYATSVTFC